MWSYKHTPVLVLVQSGTDADLFCLSYSNNTAQTWMYFFSPITPFNSTPQYIIPCMFQEFYPLMFKCILDNYKMPLFLGCQQSNFIVMQQQ